MKLFTPSFQTWDGLRNLNKRKETCVMYSPVDTGPSITRVGAGGICWHFLLGNPQNIYFVMKNCLGLLGKP